MKHNGKAFCFAWLVFMLRDSLQPGEVFHCEELELVMGTHLELAGGVDQGVMGKTLLEW